MFIYKLTLSHDTIAYIDSNEQKSQQRTLRIKTIAEKKNNCFLSVLVIQSGWGFAHHIPGDLFFNPVPVSSSDSRIPVSPLVMMSENWHFYTQRFFKIKGIKAGWHQF